MVRKGKAKLCAKTFHILLVTRFSLLVEKMTIPW